MKSVFAMRSKFVFLSLLGVLVFTSGCSNKDQTYKIIDEYMDEKGVEVVEKALDEIIKKRQAKSRPTLEDRMKERVDVSIAGAPVKGPKDAPITIVEFSDFECPFCRRVLPTLEKVEKDYKGKIRLAFRQNPLPFHKNAKPAAKAAMAAQEQGKFWEFHDKLFENQRELSDENYVKWAKELGLNVEKFKKDMKNPKYDARIKEDEEFARGNGASGTPSFFINGVRLVGAQPYEQFKEVIDALLKEKS